MQENSCTFCLFPLQYSTWQTMTAAQVRADMATFATSTDLQKRLTCYALGPQCPAGMTDASTGQQVFTVDCLKALWQAAGCTNLQYVFDPVSPYLGRWQAMTFAQIKTEFTTWATTSDFMHRNMCYYTSPWPADSCPAGLTDSSTGLSASCLKTMWLAAGCTNVNRVFLFPSGVCGPYPAQCCLTSIW